MLYFTLTGNGRTLTKGCDVRTYMVLVAGEADLPAQIRARELMDGLVFDYVFFAKTPHALAIATLATVDEKSQTQGLEALDHGTLGPLLIQERLASSGESVAKYLNNPAIRSAMEGYDAKALTALQELLPRSSDKDDMVLVVVPSAPLAGVLAHAFAKKDGNNLNLILNIPMMKFQPGEGFVAIFFNDGSLLSIETLT